MSKFFNAWKIALILFIICLTVNVISAEEIKSSYASPVIVEEKNFTSPPDINQERMVAAETSEEEKLAIHSDKIRETQAIAVPNLVSPVRISNAYIDLAVGSDLKFTLGTTGGDPSTPNDNNKKLLFGHPNPWSSFTTIRVDGSNGIYGDVMGTITSASTNVSGSTSSVWNYQGIGVTQTLSFVPNPATGRPDVLKIDYRLQNTGTVSHLVGTRVMLDTMLDGNDAAPFRIPGVGAVTTEREFTKAAHTTPQYWQAFDSLTSPTITSQGTVIGNLATEPSKSQFTSWGHVHSTSWNYVIDPAYTNGDSAVTYTWDEITLAPGQSVEYVTYYGIGSMTGSSNADIALAVTGPAELSIVSNAYSPNPFTIVAYVENKKLQNITNVQLQLTLPAGLTSQTSLTQSIANIVPGQAGQVSWMVTAANQATGQNLVYQVGASGTGIISQGVTKSILIPGLTHGNTLGVFRNGAWYLDYDGNGVWNGPSDRTNSFGIAGDIPVVGDWDNNGISNIGVFRPSTHMFYLDYNGNGVWNGAVTDRAINFGITGDIPVAGDWNHNGFSDIGVFRPSTHMFYLDYNGNGIWNGAVTDRAINFGITGDIPVAGDWNNNGFSDIGVFRPSTHVFYLDYNGNGVWNGAATDKAYAFGIAGDIPVPSDLNNNGFSEIGIFRPSTHTFYIDYSGNGLWQGAVTDRSYSFGLTGDKPVSGKW